MRLRIGGLCSHVAGLVRSAAASLAVAIALPLCAQTAPAGDGFRVSAIELRGSTLLTEADWTPIAATILDRDIGFADLEAVRARIEGLYRDRGWRLATVRIPAQETSTGVIRFEATEPVLSGVTVSGNVNFSSQNWLAAFPSLRVGTMPDLHRLDRDLTLTNEHPAKRGEVVFLPGDKLSELRAEIRAQDSPPASWLAFLDNTGNAQTGKLRYGLAYRDGALWDRDHQFNVQLISAPNASDNPNHFSLLPSDKVQIFGANYRIPFYARGASLDATLGYSTVNSGTLANLFSVSGRGSIAGLRYTQLTDRVGDWEPRWFIAQDYRKFENRAVFGGVNFAPDIEVHPVSAGIAATRVGQGFNSGFNASLATNLPGGNRGGDQDFEANRAGASPHYKIVRFGGDYATVLGQGLLTATVDGQWTGDLLISGEQFAAGGASTVRGYSERFVAGDRGLRFQLEGQTANLLDSSRFPEASVRAAAFVDGGYLERNRAAVLERGYSSVASVGLGLRLAYKRASFRLDAALPLHQHTGLPSTSGAVHFSAAIGF